jgi:hypothetical protein
MNEAMKFMAMCGVEEIAPLGCVSRPFWPSSRSQGTRPLRREQTVPQQIRIRQCEAGIQPRGILRQPAVAHFAKAPQALDHMEDMLDSSPSGAAPTVDEPLILAQRGTGIGGSPIDPVADAGSQGSLAMRLAPVGLVTEHLALMPVQECWHLRDVTHVRRRGCEAVNDAAPVGADVRLHTNVPVFAFARLVRLDQRQQPRARNHCVHLSEKSLAARDLALLLPSNRGKRRLLHRSISSTAAAHCTQYRSFNNTCAELP